MVEFRVYNVNNKKELELLLERVKKYDYPKRELEQYETPSSIAAHILWEAFMRGDISGKVIADLGCGSGKFAIGALILGAFKAICIDIDYGILRYALKNSYSVLGDLSKNVFFVLGDVRELLLNRVDTVLMNPPFGVVRRNRGIDLAFLRKALEIANSIYTIHKYSEGLVRIIRDISEKTGYVIVHEEILEFPIPMIYESHRRRVYRVKTIFYVLRRVNSNGEE
ncbi:MAG: METTL5 family protein [Thermoprotei archaeon]